MASESLENTLGKVPPTPGCKFSGHRGHISSFVFLHDNVHIVSSSLDDTMRKWNCETGLLIGEPWIGQGRINELALSPDGKTIACGRGNGSVQMWNTDGEMIEEWIDHTSSVGTLSWSRSGNHIASGSRDGTILIRKAESGEVEVGPIETNQRCVYSVAYSPSGDRIASGGYNDTICIWDSSTGELRVGPIQDLGFLVTSVVWSSNGSKLYSASDKFIRVFDGFSGVELHRFQHDGLLYSLALSPTHNLLVCVGARGIAQIWDTESHQSLGHSFHKSDREYLAYVSFSYDGGYLAYGGSDGEITLWMVKDVISQGVELGAPPEFPSSSYLNIDATEPFTESGPGYFTGNDGPYHNFFTTSQPFLSSPLPDCSSRHRLWKFFSIPTLLRPPGNRLRRLQGHVTPRRNFLHWTLSALANSKPAESVSRWQVRAGNERGEPDNVNNSTDNIPTTINRNNNEGKPGEESFADSPREIHPSHSPSSKLNNNEYRVPSKLRMRSQKNDTQNVVEVHAVRGFQRYVVHKRKHKSRVPDRMVSAHITAAHVSSTSQAQYGGQCLQGSEVPSQLYVPEITPSHFATCCDPDDDSDSDSSIQGTCSKVLYKICFPRGSH